MAMNRIAVVGSHVMLLVLLPIMETARVLVVLVVRGGVLRPL